LGEAMRDKNDREGANNLTEVEFHTLCSWVLGAKAGAAVILLPTVPWVSVHCTKRAKRTVNAQ